MTKTVLLAALVALLLLPPGVRAQGSAPRARVSAMTHTCPADLTAWRAALGAEWVDCRQVADLTTTGNPYTDPSSLYGMGNPPGSGSSGSLNSKYSTPTTPTVSGLQIDGYFPDGCDAFVPEPAPTAKNGQPFIPGCTPPANPANTCAAACHHDGQFVIRIPDAWDGALLSTGTPGVRDAFASDYIFSDYALEKGWAYVSQDKGNIGANFYRAGCDETGTCGGTPTRDGLCTDPSHPWCPAAAIQEWTYRVRQATRATRALLQLVAPAYNVGGVTRSYVAGISNGGYQTRRALETDTASDRLYDGGVDWEGTLFLPSVPDGVVRDTPTTGYNLLTYLPTSLANSPDDISPSPAATTLAALAAVGFNPESQPLWAYHYGVYWGLTQKIYRLELDPEYTGYTCLSTSGIGPPCALPPAYAPPPTGDSGDPDASYDYNDRAAVLPDLTARLGSVANTGDIQHPLITLQGDQDALLPIKTDADLYAQMVRLKGHDGIYRYYTVRGGNHVDPQFDDHYGVDNYGNTLLRPMLPCVRAALDALTGWVDHGTAPPAGGVIPRPAGASASDLANTCSLASATPTGSGPTATATHAPGPTATTTPTAPAPTGAAPSATTSPASPTARPSAPAATPTPTTQAVPPPSTTPGAGPGASPTPPVVEPSTATPRTGPGTSPTPTPTTSQGSPEATGTAVTPPGTEPASTATAGSTVPPGPDSSSGGATATAAGGATSAATATPPASAGARPGATAWPPIGTRGCPRRLPFAVVVPRGKLAPRATITVRLDTMARARARITVKLSQTVVTVRQSNTRRDRRALHGVANRTKTTVLFRETMAATADRSGHLSASVRLGYVPTKETRVALDVSASAPCNTSSRSLRIILKPAPRQQTYQAHPSSNQKRRASAKGGKRAPKAKLTPKPTPTHR